MRLMHTDLLQFVLDFSPNKNKGHQHISDHLYLFLSNSSINLEYSTSWCLAKNVNTGYSETSDFLLVSFNTLNFYLIIVLFWSSAFTDTLLCIFFMLSKRLIITL